MKAWLIRNMSVKMQVQESVIETVVNHQFESAYAALEKCSSLEFSGFGKFFFNRPKAEKKLITLNIRLKECQEILDDPQTSDIKRKNTLLKKEATEKTYIYLNNRLHGPVQDLRRMEEQAVPSGISEGTNYPGEQPENENMLSV